MFRCGADIPNFQPREAAIKLILDTFFRRVSRASGDSRFFATKKGYIGFGPRGMKDGDVLVVLYGADMPFVLRKDTAQNDISLCGALFGCFGEGFLKRNHCLASKQAPAMEV